ncbi:MAG: UPF0175 family protein [Archaeoglobus sp.]|nr:UPF0175 family protein [Archaeoglobus sp.]
MFEVRNLEKVEKVEKVDIKFDVYVGYRWIIMGGVEITIKLPPEINEKEAKLALAIELFRDGKLTVEQAAELAGITPEEFLKILARKERSTEEDMFLLYIAEKSLKEDWESEEDEWWDEY